MRQTSEILSGCFYCYILQVLEDNNYIPEFISVIPLVLAGALMGWKKIQSVESFKLMCIIVWWLSLGPKKQEKWSLEILKIIMVLNFLSGKRCVRTYKRLCTKLNQIMSPHLCEQHPDVIERHLSTSNKDQ